MKNIGKLFLCMFLIVLCIGCGKSKVPKIVTTVKLYIDNGNTNSFDATLNIDKNNDFISIDVSKDTASLNVNEDVLKTKDVLESISLLMNLAIDKGIINNNTSISVNVDAPSEKKEELYRYIYKNVLDPLNNKNINIEIDYKFNE